MLDNNANQGPTSVRTSTPKADMTEMAEASTIAELIVVDCAPGQLSQVCREISQLSEKEQTMVAKFAAKIDVANTSAVLQYGVEAQKQVAEFSASTLNSIRTKDMGNVGDMLATLTTELQGFSFEEGRKPGLRGMFRKAQNRLALLKAQYDKAETNVDKIVSVLQSHQVTLLKDIAILDKMYELNIGHFKELTLYILAGKQKLHHVQENDLKALQVRAAGTGLPEDAQAARDLAGLCNRFEKKIHDLELTRTISIQMAPQIRMIQNNDALMIEKIQTSVANTIPLWKSQMVLAVSLHHSQQAMQAQKKVNDITNELLRKNAEALKTGATEIAKESERGIVDLETLKETNQKLIETLEEVRQIQAEGSRQRREASRELVKLEDELKQKLLQIAYER